MRQHLESNGARVIRVIDLNNFPLDQLKQSYVVIPHDAEIDLTALPAHAGSYVSWVTNWWVERCLYGKRLVDPADDVLSRPFERLSISGMFVAHKSLIGSDVVRVLRLDHQLHGVFRHRIAACDQSRHTYGYVNIRKNRTYCSSLTHLAGATYDEQLSVKTSVVICNPPTVNTPKIKFATDKRIPAVHVTWLWACLRSGRLQSYDEYQLNKTTQPPPQDPKQKLQPQANVDTEPLPEGPSKPLQKAQTANVASRQPPQQIPQRPGGLNLAPSADATLPITANKSALRSKDSNNLNQDDDPIISAYDGGASHPHQAINAASPPRPSTPLNNSYTFSRPRSSSAESLIAPASRKPKNNQTTVTRPLGSEPGPDVVIPPDTEPLVPQEASKPRKTAEEKDYSSILAQLRANRKTAPGPSDQATSKTRVRRQLGRATSTRSNASGGESSGDILADDDNENTVVIEEYQASQTLGWDSPGAAKAREQMIRKLGGTVQEKSVAVEEIGVVRDVGGEELPGRAGRKRRG